MFAEILISHEIFPLKKTDTCETASVFMHNWNVSHLPVVENGKVLGYVSLDEIFSAKKSDKMSLFIKNDKQFTSLGYQHLFEVIKIFDETGLTTISVLNNENNFIGIISFKEILKSLFRDSSLSQDGGIITLEMLSKDYSLAEISRIVEYNDIKIINVFIRSASQDENKILVSLKLNQTELKNVVASLERHGKLIRSIQLDQKTDEVSSFRYDWLIKYLNT
ncbi:MAG: CBS domain-containing protein [Bacteroidota bacterium]